MFKNIIFPIEYRKYQQEMLLTFEHLLKKDERRFHFVAPPGAGKTRCLIGTRSLLGEGWDAIKLNTLIDLTLVSTFVSVNQIRGRTIRSDEDNPVKVANNWDIVSITGGFDRGFYDFERFKRKHAQFYGLSEDDVIEKGIGHVYPALTNANMATILSTKDDINQIMFERSLDRFSIYKRWKVGEPYKGYETISMEIVPMQKNIQYQIPKMKAEKTNEYRFYIKKQQDQLDNINTLYKRLLDNVYVKTEVRTRKKSIHELQHLDWSDFPDLDKKIKLINSIDEKLKQLSSEDYKLFPAVKRRKILLNSLSFFILPVLYYLFLKDELHEFNDWFVYLIVLILLLVSTLYSSYYYLVVQYVKKLKDNLENGLKQS